MKKVLVSALALGLVVGVAATASAGYDKFEISGHYKWNGYYATNTDKTDGAEFYDEDSASSAWMTHRVRLYPKLTVNDKTKLTGELRINDGTFASDGANGGTDAIDMERLWMDWSSPIGAVSIGSKSWGAWGTAFGDTVSTQAAIVVVPNWMPKPFNMVLVYGKLSEADFADDGAEFEVTAATYPAIWTDADGDGQQDTLTDAVNATPQGHAWTNQDYDYYEFRVGYKTDAIDTQFGLGKWDKQVTDEWERMRIRGYAKIPLGAIKLELEADHIFGDTSATTDADAWGLYAALTAKSGNMDLGAMTWYASGDGDTTDDEDEAYGTSGKDFEPTQILNGDDFGLLNTDTTNDVSDAIAVVGQIGVAFTASMPVSDKMTIGTVIASAWVDEDDGDDDHLGYEVDLSMDYKLLDNLTYSINFAYFDAGDAIEDDPANEADDITMISHTLNMTF